MSDVLFSYCSSSYYDNVVFIFWSVELIGQHKFWWEAVLFLASCWNLFAMDCRMQDVGKPKSEVAAARVMQRVKGVTVIPHFCKIEDKDIAFYKDFQIIVLGLDSLEARSYINSVICGFVGMASMQVSTFGCLGSLSSWPASYTILQLQIWHMRACLPESLLANIFLSSKVKDCIMIFKWVLANARYFSSVSILGQEEYEEDGSPDLSTIKPLVDGGTEGFKGHARVIIPGITPCFHCSLWLFPPQITFPLCTLAETPRSPAHCIEYAHLIQWGQVWIALQLLYLFFFKISLSWPSVSQLLIY